MSFIVVLEDVAKSRTKFMRMVFLATRGGEGEHAEGYYKVLLGHLGLNSSSLTLFSREVLDYLDSLADKGLVDILPRDIYIQYNFKLIKKGREELLKI